MTAEQLKNSILQMAVSGKLVPQDPNEEPVSVLLDHIREEKERLVKEGKIKKEKKPSYIFRGADNTPYEILGNSEPISIADEVPFDIPDSWEWARFGSVTINRDSERIPLSVDERQKLEKKYDYYGASGVIDKVDRYLFDKPLLLIGEDGANLLNRSTPIAFIATGKYWVNNHAHVIDAPKGLLLQYLEIYINAISLAPYVTGTAQPKMNQAKMNSILVPIPTTSEQKRIIEAISRITPYINEYQICENQLSVLNTTFPEKLKKSIIQMAISGKLVPQDPNEEPASVLLERISKEKDQLVKEGKIKKEKPLPEIDEAEIPFEIPSNWEWCRLSNLGFTQTGNTPSKTRPEFFGNYIPFIGPGDIQNNIIRYDNQGLSELGREYGRVVDAGSILQVCIGGSIGKCAITKQTIAFNQQINAITPILVCNEYLLYILSSGYFTSYIKEHAGGTATPIVNRGMWDAMVIPVPPLPEQKRIVALLEVIMPLCERLKP